MACSSNSFSLKTERLSAQSVFQTVFEGHPGFLHGGIIATLLDETMSKAVRARGLTAMTRHLEVDYRRPVPSVLDSFGGPYRSRRRKKAFCRSHDLRTGSTLLAHGKGVFIEVRPAKTVMTFRQLYFNVASHSRIVLSREMRWSDQL